MQTGDCRGYSVKGLSAMKMSYVFLALVLVYAVAAPLHSRYRVIDGDEGFYASAARLVGEGKIPYLDFFYPQAPILPFVYGAWTTLSGYSLVALRILSCLFTIATVALWAWFLYTEHGLSPWVAFTSFLVLMLNPFLMTWGIVVKTFALSNFLATVAMISLWRFVVQRNTAWLFSAGMACGLLVSTRLLYMAVPVVIACWLLLRVPTINNTIHRWRILLVFVSGLFLACIPALLLFLRDPEVFMFNNVGYHLLRSDTPATIPQFKSALLFLRDTFLAHPYMVFQLAIVGIGAYSLFRRRLKRDGQYSPLAEVSLAVIAALVITSLTPYPLYEQYFTSPLAPLVIPLVGIGIHFLWERNRLVVFACLMLTGLISFRELRNEEIQASTMRGWEMQTFENVTEFIRSHTADTDTVISSWPGYACESGRRFFPGLENQFALPIATSLSPANQHRYRIVGTDSIISAIEHGNAEMVVIGVWMGTLFADSGENERKDFFSALAKQYQMAGEIENVSFYVRKR